MWYWYVIQHCCILVLKCLSIWHMQHVQKTVSIEPVHTTGRHHVMFCFHFRIRTITISGINSTVQHMGMHTNSRGNNPKFMIIGRTLCLPDGRFAQQVMFLNVPDAKHCTCMASASVIPGHDLLACGSARKYL